MESTNKLKCRNYFQMVNVTLIAKYFNLKFRFKVVSEYKENYPKLTSYPASTRDYVNAEDQNLKIIKFKEPEVRDYVKNPADYKHKMQKGDDVDIPKINSGLRYESHIIYQDQKTERANKRPVEPVSKIVNASPIVQEASTERIKKEPKFKEDIKDSFNFCHNTYKEENSDFKINYLQPDQSAYRVRRFEVYHQKKEGPSIAKDVTSVYKSTF